MRAFRVEPCSDRIPVTIVCVLGKTAFVASVSRRAAGRTASTPLIVSCPPGRIPPTIAPSALVQEIVGDPASFGQGLYRALQARFGEAAPAMQFDRVVVIAAEDVDPVPLAQLLCADAQLSLSCQLESIVALADADALGRTLREDTVARRAVAIADRLVVRLRDPVADYDLAQTLTAVRGVNPQLSISLESMGEGSNGLAPRSRAEPFGATPELAPTVEQDRPTSTVRAYSVEVAGCLDLAQTQAWLTKLCIALGDDLYRLRSVCSFRGMDRLVQFNGFGAVLGPPVFGATRTKASACSLITVSGRGLDPERLATSARRCTAASVAVEMRLQPGAIY